MSTLFQIFKFQKIGILKFSKKLNSLDIDHKTLFIEKEGHGYFDEDVRYESNMELIRFFKEHLN